MQCLFENWNKTQKFLKPKTKNCSKVCASTLICPKPFAWSLPRATQKWANQNHNLIQHQQLHIPPWCTTHLPLDVSKLPEMNKQTNKQKIYLISKKNHVHHSFAPQLKYKTKIRIQYHPQRHLNPFFDSTSLLNQ